MNKIKLHIDTDIGADADDLCALAYAALNEEAELIGVSTALEKDGRRADYVRYALSLIGGDKSKIPVAAGTNGTLSGDKDYGHTFLPEEKLWGKLELYGKKEYPDAVELLHNSVLEGAVIAVLGPMTNIAKLLAKYPEDKEKIKLFAMGGSIWIAEKGYPQWGPAADWNINMDFTAAQEVINNVPLTLVPIPPTLKTFVTERDLCTLDLTKPIQKLVAIQTRAWCEHVDFIKNERQICDKLPKDLQNFHYDPLTTAIAVGFPKITIEEKRVKIMPSGQNKSYDFFECEGGNNIRLVTDVDGEAFNHHWLDVIRFG